VHIKGIEGDREERKERRRQKKCNETYNISQEII
jgi:hypothetical protein